MKKSKFTLLQLMLLVGCFLLAVFLLPRIARAQPYLTNNGTVYGGQTYNQNYPTPLQASKALAIQYSAGTLAGYITTNLTPFYFVTNTFATNIYTAPPFVIATADTNGLTIGGVAGVAGSNTVTVCITTTTNFVLQLQKTNCGVYWEATGH